MSEVISFRLDTNNPREAQALAVLVCQQERGYSARQVLTEALLKYDQPDKESDIHTQLAEILTTMHRVNDQVGRLQRIGIGGAELVKEKQATLSDAFVMSVKSAAKPGITLES